MKTLNTAFIKRIVSQQFKFALLVKMEFSSGIYRYTNHDIPIFFDGRGYNHADFKISNVQTTSKSVVENVTLEFANADQSMSAIVLDADVVSLPVTLYLVVLDDVSNRPKGEPDMELFTGLVSTWELDEKTISFTIASEMIKWNKRALRKAQANCRWEFKGLECTYAGEATSCNKSWERCSALNNTLNYGGFRFLPSTSEQVVWWGRNPS
jgi:phage-related protein